jgi:hypothetical protein
MKILFECVKIQWKINFPTGNSHKIVALNYQGFFLNKNTVVIIYNICKTASIFKLTFI